MVISKTGKITDDFYALGHPAIPIYLLDGPAPAIFDAGFACLADLYIREIKDILGDRHPSFCFLTHAHFDHCGSIAALKTVFPGMQVVASHRCVDILNNPKAVETIDQLNQEAAEAVVDFGIDRSANGSFGPFAVDRCIDGDESIRLSKDLHMRAIETPGHTRDCYSYLIEEKKILITSEALGQENPKKVIVTDCLSDYDAYRQSVDKLARLEAETVCPGHFFIYTAKDAKRYPERAASACRQFYALVQTIDRETGGDLQQMIRRIKAIEYDGISGPRQPEKAYTINLEARINAVLRAGNAVNADV